MGSVRSVSPVGSVLRSSYRTYHDDVYVQDLDNLDVDDVLRVRCVE